MTLKKLFVLVFLFGSANIGFSMNWFNSQNNLTKNNSINIKNQQFNFGRKQKNKTGIIIDYSVQYDSETGYGFDFNTSQNVQIKANNFSAIKPTYFSIKLPEGNYSIKVTMGSSKQESDITIKAEYRRFMLAEQAIQK